MLRRFVYGWPLPVLLAVSLVLGVVLLPDICVATCDSDLNVAATDLLLLWLVVLIAWIAAWVGRAVFLVVRDQR